VRRHSFPWEELRYTLWLPFYLAGFLLLELLPGRSYWATQLPVDALIPFKASFVIPYCLWYPLLVGVGLWLLAANHPAFRRYLRFLAVTFCISELIWALFPSVQQLRPALMGTDPLTALVAALYQVDTNTNVFPSVHVVGAVGAALAVWDGTRRPLPRWSVVVLAVLICLSTVFIKQHSVLDLAGGLVLSLLAAIPIYSRHC